MNDGFVFRLGLLAGILFLSLSVTSVLHAQPSGEPACSAFLERSASFSWKGASGRGYEKTAPQMWERSLAVVNVEQGVCSLSLVVDGFGAKLSGPGAPLEFVISGSASGADLSSLGPDPLTTPLTGTASENGEIEFPLFFSVRPGQVVRAGEYTASVPVRLFALGEGLPQVIDEAVIDIQVLVASDLSVTASGMVGSSADIDLGDIASGFNREFQFTVNSNAPVSVSVSSVNRGSLAHEKADIGIPYSAIFEGNPLNLAAGEDEVWFNLPIGRDETLDLSLASNPMTAPVAGRYEDTLTVVFRSDM